MGQNIRLTGKGVAEKRPLGDHVYFDSDLVFVERFLDFVDLDFTGWA